MSSIAIELDSVLATLGSERARVLEAAVRKQIAQAKDEAAEWQRVMVLMARNHPQAAECVGTFADTEFQRPLQGEVPSSKEW